MSSEPVRQLDGRRDLRADSERENRAEAGNFETCSHEASGGDRAVPSERDEHQVEQQEPHGEATRDSHQSGRGQESQLRASRMMLASRRVLPNLPLPLDGVHASFGHWSGDTRDHPCRGGVIALPPLTSDVVFAGTQIRASAGCLGKGEGPHIYATRSGSNGCVESGCRRVR